MAKDKPAGTRGLGGLADALVKAGLADDSRVRKTQHDQRLERHQLGPEELARQQAEKDAAFAAARAAEAEASRSRARAEGDAATRERARTAIRSHLEPGRGPKRWYYVARDGRIPFVEVSDTVMKALGEGRAAIVESLEVCAEEHVVVQGEPAIAELRAVDPEIVRFWNRPGGERAGAAG